MPRHLSGRRSALLATLTFALVFLVALGSSRSLARVGGPGRIVDARLVVGDLYLALLGIAVLVLGALVYAVSGRPRRRRDDEFELVLERPPIAWWEKLLALALALATIAGLAAAVVFFTRRGGGEAGRPRPLAPTPAGRPSAHPATTPLPHEAAPPVHWWILAGLALAALAAASLVLVRRRRHRHAGDNAHEVEADELREVIEETLDELEREIDPRRAVIRAYTGMERVLARRGLARHHYEAPLEYLARSLAAIRVSRPAGERLTALFARARFSEHPIEVEMKGEAIAALAAVRDELEAQTP